MSSITSYMEEEKHYSRACAAKPVGDTPSPLIINTMTVSIQNMNKKFVVL